MNKVNNLTQYAGLRQTKVMAALSAPIIRAQERALNHLKLAQHEPVGVRATVRAVPLSVALNMAREMGRWATIVRNGNEYSVFPV